MWLFAFGNLPLSVESLYLAAPLCCPLAFFVYRKSRLLGTSAQAALYALALVGAFQMIQADCARGNCDTHNPVFIAFATTFAGFHMIGMLATLVLMAFGVGKGQVLTTTH